MRAKHILTTEKKEELTQPFAPGLPVTVYVTVFGPETYDYVDWHWHDEVQYCLVLSGEVCFRVADQTCRVPRGGGLIINSKVVHMSQPGEGDGQASYLCANLSTDLAPGGHGAELCRRYLSPILERKGFQARLLAAGDAGVEELLGCLERVYELAKPRKAGTELLLYGEVLRIWGYTARLLGEGAAPPPDGRGAAKPRQDRGPPAFSAGSPLVFQLGSG